MTNAEKIAQFLYKEDGEEKLAIGLIKSSNEDVKEVVELAVKSNFKFPKEFSLNDWEFWDYYDEKDLQYAIFEGIDSKCNVVLSVKNEHDCCCIILCTVKEISSEFEFVFSDILTKDNVEKLFLEVLIELEKNFQERLKEEVFHQINRIEFLINQ